MVLIRTGLVRHLLGKRLGTVAEGVTVTRRGRHRLLVADLDTRYRYVDAIRGGSPLRLAAEYAGINVATVWRALRRAEEAEEKVEGGLPLTDDEVVCLEFAEEVNTARAAVVARNVAVVRNAAQGGRLLAERTFSNGAVERVYAPPEWRAAAWFLEMSFPGEFKQPRRGS